MVSMNVQFVKGMSLGEIKYFPNDDGTCSEFWTRDLRIGGEDGERTVVTMFAHSEMALLTPEEQERRVTLAERAAHDDKAEAALVVNS